MRSNVGVAHMVVDLLNELVELDRPAIAALIANRVPCNALLADHPTVQVSEQHGGFHVGILGVLNGICGTREDGRSLIEAIFEDVENSGYMFFRGFRVSEPSSE